MHNPESVLPRRSSPPTRPGDSLDPSRFVSLALCVALALTVGVGVLGRGYWTPDEPREADISWRMSWQDDKSVPLLAGDAFCEKPPLAYWLAGTAMHALGTDAWAARLPNLLYALITALATGLLARRGAGRLAGWTAGAAITTFLLSYQVSIWLATDAPLLASVAVALLGLYAGFYAERTPERLRGYTGMHAALAVGFLSKSAAGWMVPVTAFLTLVVWERRWREFRRWELYAGVGVQALFILAWVEAVYLGPHGAAHLKVFFWNNLAGRFAHVDAPQELQYTGAHHNTPGKYFIELPLYLWPWTLLVLAAIRRAWIERHASEGDMRLVRFCFATMAPTLVLLSVAATARNIYLAPALPGAALLLGWWVRNLRKHDDWDLRAIQGTSFLLLLAVTGSAVAAVLIGWESWDILSARGAFMAIAAGGIAAAGSLGMTAWRALRRGLAARALLALLLAYCALLVGPASQIYRRIDEWQNLAVVGRAVGRDSGERPMILFTADETTRGFIDMYARTSVTFLPGPLSPDATQRLRQELARAPQSVVIVQLAAPTGGRSLRTFGGLLQRKYVTPLDEEKDTDTPPWAVDAGLRVVRRYGLPHGRRYALLEVADAGRSR